MPLCTNCGKKEVDEGVWLCPDCSQRLEIGFTPDERQKHIQEPQQKTRKKKAGVIIAIVIAIIVIALVVVCVSGPMAEVEAIHFLNDVTGNEYVGVGLSSTKVVTGPDTLTGLEAGESRWLVEGTVQNTQTKTKYTVWIFVDELANHYWGRVSIYMAQGVNVPLYQLLQLYPYR
ncbi:MAG: hypothetical protein ABSF21_00665 [Dehalococcoidia bacterium]